jgi:ketosteroid isomerase-like protein
MNRAQATSYAEKFLTAWNSQDVEAVIACYAADVVYHDPTASGEVRGAEGMRKYLHKLFAAWTMRWELREAFGLQEPEGVVVLWHAAFGRRGDEETVEVDGVDLLVTSGQLILRNEVFYDRAAFASIGAGRGKAATGHPAPR